MSDEEKTAVEETKTVEEVEAVEKAEVEEKAVEEKAVEEVKTEGKAVEETKVEAKTDEKAKEGDAKEETKTTGGGGSVSEEAVEMLKAALPETLPLGTVLKINKRLYYPNQPGTPSENSQTYVIGLPDGNVGMYIPSDSGLNTDAAVEVVSYDDMIERLATYGTDESLESAWCGCAMPSKDSIRFVANITVIDEGSK